MNRRKNLHSFARVYLYLPTEKMIIYHDKLRDDNIREQEDLRCIKHVLTHEMFYTWNRIFLLLL